MIRTKKYFVLGMMVLVPLVSIATWFVWEKNAIKFYSRRAYTAWKAGEYDKAIRLYDEILRRDPSRAQTLVNRGSAYSRIGQCEKAISDLDKAIILSPSEYWYLGRRGGVYEQMGKYERALEDYTRVVESEVTAKITQGQSPLNRGRVLRKMGKFAEAKDEFCATLRVDANFPPYTASVSFEMGLIHFCEGEWKDAVECFSKATRGYQSFSHDRQIPLFTYVAKTLAGQDGRVDLERWSSYCANNPSWHLPAVDLFLGQTTTNEMLSASTNNVVSPVGPLTRTSDAYFHLGCYHLLNNEKAAAKTCFERCISLGVLGSLGFQCSPYVLKFCQNAEVSSTHDASAR